MTRYRNLQYIALIAALGGLLFGYDTAVISGAIGNITKYFLLTPIEVGWAISSALLGCLTGALLSDYCSTKFGRKWSMVIAAILFLICSIGTALPASFTSFIIYRIIGGLGVGIASMVVPMYIAEIAPAEKRGALVAYNQLAIVIGITVVYFVNYFIALQGNEQWNLTQGWRWMFGSEMIPSLLFLMLLFFIPESPRWLLMKNKNEKAKKVLEKFNGEKAVYVLEDIKASLGNNTKVHWKLLLYPSVRLALFVGIGLSIFQQVTGINAILYYAPEIFKSFGSSSNSSLLETSFLGVINLLFTIIAIFLVDKKGRKPLLYIGTTGMFVALSVVGYAAYFHITSTWLLPFLLLFMASFSISWGPIVWVLLSEIFPNKERSLALSIAVFIQWVANFFVSQTFPVMTDNKMLATTFHGAFPFILYAVFCLIALAFVWKYVPETKNKTLEEMNLLWELEITKKIMQMKKINTLLFFLSISLIFSTAVYCQQNPKEPFKKIKSIPETFRPLFFSEIKPTGWLKEQIENNLNGFTGHLDSLVPDLILKDDIYNKDRLSKKIKSKDVGAVSDGGDWQVQFLWWNSETQSNWWDGYIRSAILANGVQHLTRIENYIQRILSTQDADGYLGIYDKELRYKFNNENGELWSKTTLLRGLLAWYEYKKDKSVLTAIERAVQNVITNYPINASYPFYSIQPNAGGLTHGLVFTDVLEELFRLTKNEKYRDYCLFLYKDLSEQLLNEDAQYKKLIDSNYKLKGHGVHTYEHLRAVAAAVYASGNPELKQALNNFLKKINSTTTISGGPLGDEWISGRKADETNAGYEYCSLQELMNSYEDLFLKTGASKFGDKTEQIFFNAAQGSRNPDYSCIAYLKTDNSYYMTGGLNGDTSYKKQTRYSYSPTHQDAAVCCVPNAGRIAPYYIQYMWMKDKNALVATLLGPCDMQTNLNGKKISIKEITDYPFQHNLTFRINAEQTTYFILKIRKPEWAEKIIASEKYILKDGFVIVDRQWNKNDSVTISFPAEVLAKEDSNNEYYFMYGPLVLAHPIESAATVTKVFDLPGFKNLQYNPVAPFVYQYSKNIIKKAGNTKLNNDLQFTTTMINSKTNTAETVLLQPMGNTILRQVTFKQKK